MESDIKVKATVEMMTIFCDLYCVKRCNHIKWLNDGKRRNLYDVTLRHADAAGELKGTYTVETLMKRFREDGETNLPCVISHALKDTTEFLSIIGEQDKLAEYINKAFERMNINLKVA